MQFSRWNVYILGVWFKRSVFYGVIHKQNKKKKNAFVFAGFVEGDR